MTWGFIERITVGEEGNSSYRVTYIDLFDGQLIGVDDPAPENIMEFLEETGIASDVNWGATPGDYSESYPWEWRLPFEESSNAYVTCGYGCYQHTGLDYYATDWDPGNEGHLLESVASCWITYAGWNNYGYGYNVIGECGDAGGGKRYGFRVAHLKSAPLVRTSQWVGKGKNLGYMGMTGIATAPHVHYVVYRGTISGGTVSGESLPISQWPSSSDSICEGDFATYGFWGYVFYSIGHTQSDGCK